MYGAIRDFVGQDERYSYGVRSPTAPSGTAGNVYVHMTGGNVQFLAKEVYYISELPSDLQTPDVVAITVVSLILSLLATLYPSWRASRVNPAEALRYE